MQFDRNMFGEGIKVYGKGGVSTNTPLYDFTIPSQNANLSAAFKSGALTNNAPLPDSLFYWMIGKDSPYNHFSCLFRSGSSPNYTYTKKDTEKNNKNIPVVLWSGMTKINADYDVDFVNGSVTTSIQNNAFLAFNQSNFRVTGTSNTTPLWEKCSDISSYLNANGAYSSYPFILDFDYNSFIYTIKVGYGSTFVDLANYNNTPSNYISVIGAQLNTGDVSTGYARTTNQVRYDVTGQDIVYSVNAPAVAGYRVVTDFDYNAPEWLRDLGLYGYEKFRKLATINNTNYILFNGVNVSTNESNSTPSYYMDDDKWEFDNGIYKLKKHGDGIYNEDDFNYIRKLIAWLGFWFTDGGTYTDSEHSYTLYRANTLLGDNANSYSEEYMIPDRVYQAEIKNGVTTGNFTELRIAKDNDQSKWGTEWRDKNGYKGRDISEDNKNRGDLTTVLNRGTIGGSVKWFALGESQLNDLIKWTNSGYQPQNNDQFVLDYKGTNPAEYITTIMYMPFVPKSTGALRDIFIGPLNTGIQGTQLDYEYGITINLGFHTLDREYNDFRDYKPYTNISLYVPFCGTVELDAAKIYGMTINVKLMVDIATGSCTGLIFADELLIDTVSGQLGVKLPLNVFNMADYQDTIINAAYNMKSAERSKDAALIGTYAGAIVAGATSGTGIGLLAGAAGIALGQQKYNNAVDTIENIKYNVQHTQPKQTQISTADAANLLGMERNARLIITRPYPIDTNISAYGHTMGFACNKQGVLSDFTGFTAVSACDTSGINATAREKEKILTLLKSGVIIK